ncbi:MAG: hypothetical protein LUO88_01730 [Methanoregulaceae archaeon]|nr:hypothetical protein [Methanoregulaceae archaeon]
MMHFPGRGSRIIIVLVLLAVCIAAPAGATAYVEDVAVTPGASAVPPGTAMNMTCTILLSSSGAQTFVPGHTLVLSTGLERSSFSIQAYVDRRPAVFIPGTGPVVFVNGYLLAYPSSQDVSVAVAMSGSVPGDASGSITILQVEELDNSGIVIPTSVFEINQTVSQAVTATTTVPPTFSITPTKTPTTTIPATIAPAGFWTVIAGLAVALGIVMKLRRGSRG